MKLLLVILLSILSLGCKEGEKPKSDESAPAQAKAQNTAEAEAPSATDGLSPSGIQWIENDYDKAIAEAKAANKPLLIEMWAGWCHTCLAM